LFLLGLEPDILTTQIEPYDNFIELFQLFSRVNNVLNGLCKDMWLYAMIGICKQKIIIKEIGSTALPHKVNPIYFEGAEGGFGIANALFSFYVEKLSYSRLQRDLSDATVRRSFAIAFGYSLLSYQSVRVGLDRIVPDEVRMNEELNEHYEVLSEAVQSELKVLGIQDAYQKAKDFFRGKKVTKDLYIQFISKLSIAKDIKVKLINLTPHTYKGVAAKLISHEI
jgi:adenylosuccinate lyase